MYVFLGKREKNLSKKQSYEVNIEVNMNASNTNSSNH